MATDPTPRTRSLAALLFGYDVFISFALNGEQRGTRAYASDLARRLRERDFTVFFSEDEAPVGDHLDRTLVKGLHRARTLVVVANLGTLRDPRWVKTEVEEFRRRHPTRPVIPINIDGALRAAAHESTDLEWLDHAGRIWIDETAEASASGAASEDVVQRLATAPRAARSAVRLRVLTAATLLFLGSVAAVAVWQALLALRNEERAVANQRTADRNAVQAQANAASAVREASRAQAAEGVALRERDRAASEAQAARRAERQARAELAKSLALRLGADARALFAQGDARADELATQLLVATQRLTPEAAAAPELQQLLMQQWSAAGPLARALVLPPGAGGLAFSPDARRLLAGGTDGQVYELELPGLVLHTRRSPLRGQAIVALQFTADGSRLVVATREGSIAVLDPLSLAARAGPLAGGLGTFVPFALHPSGQELVAADDQGRLRRYDARSLQALGPPVAGHGPRVWGLAYAPDGKVLASAGQDRALLLRDPQSLRPLGPSFGLGSAGPWLCVIFPPQGERLAGCGGDILDAQKPYALELWPRQPGATRPIDRLMHARMVSSAAFSPDGRRLATAGSDGTLALFWATESPNLIDRWPAHRQSPEALAYSPDSRWIASRAGDGSVRLWRADTRPDPRQMQPPAPRATVLRVLHGAREAPQGLQVATGHDDGSVRLWQVSQEGGRLLATVPASGSAIVALADRAGESLLALDAAGVLRRIEPRSGAVQATEPRWPASAGAMSLSDDGRQGAFVDEAGRLVWWDVAARRARDRMAPGLATWRVRFAPDGTRLAVATVDGQVRLWQPLRPPRLLPGSSADMASSLVFSPDGRELALGSAPNLLQVATLERIPMEAPDLLGVVEPLAFDREGRHLLALENDRLSLRLRAGTRWRAVGLPMAPGAMDLAPDGTRFVVADAYGAPAVHPLPTGAADALCSMLGRNMSRERWTAGVSAVLPYTCQCPDLPLALGPTGAETGSRSCRAEVQGR